MYKKDARQLKISAILSWILTAALIIYYVFLKFNDSFQFTVVQIALVILCIISSVVTTIKAINSSKAENESDSGDKKDD